MCTTGGIHTPSSDWKLRKYQWIRHEGAGPGDICEVIDEITYNSASVKPNSYTAHDKHGTSPSPDCDGGCLLEDCGGDLFAEPNPDHYSPINLGEPFVPLNDTAWVDRPFFDLSNPHFTVSGKRMSAGNRFNSICGIIDPCEFGTQTCDECDPGRIVPVLVQGEDASVPLVLRVYRRSPSVSFDSIRVTNTVPGGGQTTFTIPASGSEQSFVPFDIATAVGNQLLLEYLDASGGVEGCMRYVIDGAEGCINPVDIENIEGGVLRSEAGVWSLRGRIGGKGRGLVTRILDGGSYVGHVLVGPKGHRFQFVLPGLSSGPHEARIEAELDFGTDIRYVIFTKAFLVE